MEVSYLKSCAFVCRGQILPATSLRHSLEVELIHEGVKFVLNVCQKSSSSFFVCMNDSFIETECHR